MIQSPEVQSRIAQLRARIADNSATLEEIREGVILLREGRHAALDASGKAKKKSLSPKGPAKSLDELNKMLDDL